MAATPQHCLDAGIELGHIEGFDHIVVGAGTQPANPLVLLVACGQHNHRNRIARFADLAQYGAAVDVGQPHIEQDQGRRVASHAHQRLRAVVRLQHPVAAMLQFAAQQLRDLKIVFDDKNQYIHPVTLGDGAVICC